MIFGGGVNFKMRCRDGATMQMVPLQINERMHISIFEIIYKKKKETSTDSNRTQSHNFTKLYPEFFPQ